MSESNISALEYRKNTTDNEELNFLFYYNGTIYYELIGGQN